VFRRQWDLGRAIWGAAREDLGILAHEATRPEEHDSAVADSKHAGVGDGGAANVSAKVLNDAFAFAEGLEDRALPGAVT
jgi:hypothetical protein